MEKTIGKRTDNEANMWLNPQSWSVISGLATEEQTEKAMENVYEKLNTKFGAILMDPPYHKEAFEGSTGSDLQCRNKGKCRYFLPVTGLADSGRGAAWTRRPGIQLTLWRIHRQHRIVGRRDPRC